MIINESYKYKPSDYEKDGIHKTKSDYSFLDFVHDCEKQFHEKCNPLYANVFSASISTLNLLKSCFSDTENEICGMESIDGDVDIDMNLEINKNSDKTLICAIGSYKSDDDPLFLITDDSCSDTQFILKYIPDDEDEDSPEQLPSPQSKIKVLTK